MSPLRRSPFRATAAALCLSTLAACGGSDGATAPAPSADATLSLSNGANVAIQSVFISSCDETTWGEDRLGATETIAPGASRTFSLPAGCYDIRASTGSKSGYWYDRDFAAGQTVTLQLSSAANEMVAAVETAGAAK